MSFKKSLIPLLQGKRKFGTICAVAHKRARTMTNQKKDKTMSRTIIKKTFDLGKVAYTGSRRTCPVEIELELRECDQGIELSICGSIWNHIHTDCYRCGQCLDELKKYVGGNPTFDRLYRLWKLYHNNGLNAGTERQQADLEEAVITDYDAACDYLKSVGLYVDKLGKNERLSAETEKANRNHFEYGCGWILRDIPDADMDEIYDVCGIDTRKAA